MKKFRQMKTEKLLTYLIKSCESFNLNEKESLLAINNTLGNNNISRRTYYYYKKEKVYKKSIFKTLKNSCYNSLDVKLLILHCELDDWRLSNKTDKQIGSQFPNKKNILKDKQRQRTLLKNDMDKINQKIDFFDKEIRSCLYNYFRSPADAVIKEEFVRCCKNNCNSCPHGPYYYAYWTKYTESGKMKVKKYQGVYDPRILEDQYI